MGGEPRIRSASALVMTETFFSVGLACNIGRLDVSASYDRLPNGACVPVGEPGPEIPAGSLVKGRTVGTVRPYPV